MFKKEHSKQTKAYEMKIREDSGKSGGRCSNIERIFQKNS